MNIYQAVWRTSRREGLGEEAVFAPAAEFLGRTAELHGIRRVRALHHDALEEITAEHAVRIAEPLVECERGGV